jgi:chemotaxis protein MotB
MRAGIAALLPIMLVGCATGDKQQSAMLEQSHRDLTGRLNAANRELEMARRDREGMNARLQAAMDEVNRLQQQLAAAPTGEAPAEGWTAVPGGAMIAIEDSILFQPGSATIRSEARRTLDAIVSTLQGQYAEKDILVLGHTDDQPIQKSGWKDNYELSAQRALAVVRYLRERGVVPARVVACGAGEFRPRSPNDSAANRARNRRVEFFALDPAMGFGAG